MNNKFSSLTGHLVAGFLFACGLGSPFACLKAWGNEQVVKSFSSTDNAFGPVDGLVQGVDGVLYGATRAGGGAGTVFALNPDGSGFKVLHDFGSISNDATNPAGSLLLGADGALYGVSGGGAHGMGAVFRLHTDGTGYQVIYSFGNLPQDGAVPRPPLVQAVDGTLYGVTYSGGWSNFGVVFALEPDGTGYHLLHSFAGSPTDAANPQAGLLLSNDGSLYGTTWSGGTNTLRAGTVFKLGADGSGFRLLHSFSGSSDGASPYGALIVGRDGALYGTTTGSGYSTSGNVFRLNADGSAYRVLYTFSNNSQSGYAQQALVPVGDGTLYGITTASQAKGSIFKLNPDGTGFSFVHSFGSVTNDGWRPNGLLLGADGALYGTTLYGGSSLQLGTVFRVTALPAAPPFVISLVPLAGGSFHIAFEGILGATYGLDASADLSNWTSLGTVSNETGQVQFLDWNATKAPQRFYRAVLMP